MNHFWAALPLIYCLEVFNPFFFMTDHISWAPGFQIWVWWFYILPCSIFQKAKVILYKWETWEEIIFFLFFPYYSYYIFLEIITFIFSNPLPPSDCQSEASVKMVLGFRVRNWFFSWFWKMCMKILIHNVGFRAKNVYQNVKWKVAKSAWLFVCFQNSCPLDNFRIYRRRYIFFVSSRCFQSACFVYRSG